MKKIERKIHTIDLEGKVLGRVASGIATLLIGKRKPDYTPNIDAGDFVVIKNASKVALTGRKSEQKEHIYNTGYPGGLRRVPWLKLDPKKALWLTVMGMLPKNKLRKERIKRMSFE